jgi:hypothetical protein
MSNHIIAIRYDIENDCIKVVREDGSVEENDYSPHLSTLATEHFEWMQRANHIKPRDVRYAFWLGAEG